MLKFKTKKSPKNLFKTPLKRFFKELLEYKKIIILALFFAILGTFLSVIAPNKLSELTDEISNGLIIRYDNLQRLMEETSKEITEEIFVDGIKISIADQIEFNNIMLTLENLDSKILLYGKIDIMPENIKSVVLPFMHMDKIKEMTLILVCIYVCSAVCMYVQGETMAEITNRYAKKFRTRISEKINNLPLKYFDKHATGEILSRTTNDIDTIAQAMNQSLENFASNIVLVIGTVVMMFLTNWIMAATALISTWIGLVLSVFILKQSQKYFIERQKELGLLNDHIEETYSNMRIVKAYNGQKQALKKFEKLNQKVYKANRRSQFFSGLVQPITELIGNLGYVAICIVGAILTMHNMISFGVIVAFIAYVKIFTSPLLSLAQSTTFFQTIAAASERIYEFLDEKDMKKQDKINKELKVEDVNGEIEFENVEFTYSGNATATIKNFSLHIKPGQKIAIVGFSGAGKTTLMSLLLKLYDIDFGDIKIDGISIKELKRENLHKICTFISREPWIFNGTIAENIRYNRKETTQERIEEVCKKIGLDEFIKKLPKGYDTKFSENDNFSAGQKQLISLARGMIEDAPILILDEAMSMLDTRTEKKISNIINKLVKTKTVILISHRLSAIKDSDLIVFLEDGEIIEKGTHAELINKNGKYAKVYKFR